LNLFPIGEERARPLLYNCIPCRIPHCKRGPRSCIIWLTKWQISFTIILWCLTWGVFVTSHLPNDKCASQLPWVTNTPHVKHHRIIAKRFCPFVSQMILYLGPLLQCIHSILHMHRYLMSRLSLQVFYLWHHVLSTAPPFILWWSNLEILFAFLYRSSPFIGGLRCQAIQTEHDPYTAERTQKAVYIVRCLCTHVMRLAYFFFVLKLGAKHGENEYLCLAPTLLCIKRHEQFHVITGNVRRFPTYDEQFHEIMQLFTLSSYVLRYCMKILISLVTVT
jgi:hypothetical protein